MSKIQDSPTKSNKTMIITAILLFAAVISAYMVFSFAGPSTTEGEKSVTIQVLDDKKNLTSYDGHDTVCYIAKDINDSICTAVSTSGLFMKHHGRLGDFR